MSTSNATHLSASGHLQQDTIVTPKTSATTDDNLVLGNVVYKKSTSNVGKNTGATEAIGAAIEGIADGTYSATGTANYWTNGQTATGLSLTAGVEYWARDDGTLDTYGNVAANKWTRSMGVADTSGNLVISIGPCIQHP